MRLGDALLPGPVDDARRPHADAVEQRLCAFWRDGSCGARPAARRPGRRDRDPPPPRRAPLGDCIGKSYLVGEGIAIPLPHPSGASSWLNVPANRERVAEATALVRAELRRVDLGRVTWNE